MAKVDLEEKVYCVKCKKKTSNEDAKKTVAKNGRNMVRATCTKCGTKKVKFVA